MGAERDVGVALSGGGHRATVFGLGALLALRDAGVHERVLSISSVSGGSIANGAVMVGPDYGTAPAADVDAHVASVVEAVASRGVLLGGAPATRWYLRSLVASGVVAAAGLLALAVGGLAGWPGAVVGAGAVALVAGLVAAWLLFVRRSDRTERAIDAELLGGAGTTLADLRGRALSVHHVVCTTEVQGGVEFFFSDRMVYGWNFGGSTRPCALPLSTAVQASACVPGAFRARRIALSALGLPPATAASGGTVDSIVVEDGGVYDNMADEWEYNVRGRLKAFPDLAQAQPTPASSLVVVNASAGWKGLKPLTGNGFGFEAGALGRARQVQYDVSTSHRRRALFTRFSAPGQARELAGVFVQIGDNPYALARSWAAGEQSDAAADRALRALAFLDGYGLSEQDWAAVATRNAAVATTLQPLGAAVCAELLEHGYVLTLVNTHVVLGFGNLDDAAARRRFGRARREGATR